MFSKKMMMMGYYSAEMKAAQTSMAQMMVMMMDCYSAVSLAEETDGMMVRVMDCYSAVSLVEKSAEKMERMTVR
jgi:hypothetical protein